MARRGRLILIVDPDLDFVEDARLLLSGERLLTARSLEEAEEIAVGGRVDAALLGPSYGNEAGVRAAAGLLAIDPTIHLVLAANVVTNRVLLAALQTGFVDVVDTPLTVRKLTTALAPRARAQVPAPVRELVVAFAPAAAQEAAPAANEPPAILAAVAAAPAAPPAPALTAAPLPEPAPPISPAAAAPEPVPAVAAAPPMPSPVPIPVPMPAPTPSPTPTPVPVPVPDPVPVAASIGAAPDASAPLAETAPAPAATGDGAELVPVPTPPVVTTAPATAPEIAAPAVAVTALAPELPPPLEPIPGAEAWPPMPRLAPPLPPALEPLPPPFPPPSVEVGGSAHVPPDSASAKPRPAPVTAQEPPTRRLAPAGESRVILVMAGKGGSGKSVTATNLAMALAFAIGEDAVAIVDADLQFGDVALLLQIDPVRSIAEVARQVEDLSEARLDALLLRHESGLRVLPAPLQPAAADAVSPKAVVQIVEKMRRLYRFVVVDTGSVLDDVLLSLLDQADEVVVVVDMDLPSVKNAKVALDILRADGYPMERLRLVVNRINSKARLDLVELERSLGLRTAAAIPSDRLVPQSVNEGVPVVALSPRSRVARAFTRLARQFLPQGSRKGS